MPLTDQITNFTPHVRIKFWGITLHEYHGLLLFLFQNRRLKLFVRVPEPSTHEIWIGNATFIKDCAEEFIVQEDLHENSAAIDANSAKLCENSAKVDLNCTQISERSADTSSDPSCVWKQKPINTISFTINKVDNATLHYGL